MILDALKRSFLLTVALTVLTAVVYPLAVTVAAQRLFPFQANGSLLLKDGRIAGSALVGQPFDAPGYFWSRLSATAPFPYNAAASSGSNLGPTNPALAKTIQDRVDALRRADPANAASVPVDLVTASASGLDPDISPASAAYQAARVAHARGLTLSRVQALITQYTQGRWLGLFGEPRVNVLALNLALDREH